MGHQKCRASEHGLLELEVAQANGEIDFPGCGPHPGESTLVAKNCDAVVMHVADPSYLRP